MRQTRRLVACAFVILVLPFVMAASITITTVTPNPGGMAGHLKGEGAWSVAGTEKETSIQFVATEKVTGQITSAMVKMGANSWDHTLKVFAPATYNPTQATLTYVDGGIVHQLTVTRNADEKVK